MEPNLVVVKIDTLDTEANGVLLLGKYQHIRSHAFEAVEFENATEGGAVQCADFWSMDENTRY